MMLARRKLSGPVSLLARFQLARSPVNRSHRSRLFTENSQLLSVSYGFTRPQLPFLYSAVAGRSSAPRGPFKSQLVRFVSSETRRYYQDVLLQSFKVSIAIILSLVALGIGKFGIEAMTIERRFPAPPEWSKTQKYQFSKVAAAHVPNDDGRLVDWPYIASHYLGLLKILEDPKQQGKNLRHAFDEDGNVYFNGVVKAGLDISEKSEPWRRGYYTCLMGAAKAVEQLDGWVADTTRKLAFPKEFVIGPSNPNPKPLPGPGLEPPVEENCRVAFPGPEALYIKILTSQGFTSRQRLEAALAYGDWLDFKGLPSTAEEMYDWALDIAMGGLPLGVDNVVDIKTGVINSKATYISSNILAATSALANHHARNNNLATALPIFLSILRARRQLSLPKPSKSKEEEKSVLSFLLSYAKYWVFEPPYPPPPPTGDEVPTRTSAAICEEAAVMSNIGEILFSSSASKKPSQLASDPVLGAQIDTASTTSQLESFQSGLSWTRDAVDLAEETLASTGVGEDDEEARKKCVQCLTAGMDNWSKMVERMLEDERAAKEASKKERDSSRSFWGRWHKGVDDQNRWESEARVVDTRSRRIKRLLVMEQERELPAWMRILGKTKDF